jgi:hypothetical protein
MTLQNKQELLEQVTKYFVFNKEDAKLMDSKTMLRRVCKVQPRKSALPWCYWCKDGRILDYLEKPPYQVGDITVGRGSSQIEKDQYFYKVTSVRVEKLQDITYDDYLKEGLKFPSIEEYAKVYNKDEESIKKENLTGTESVWKVMFRDIWNSTAEKGISDWNSNPYLWVIEYEKIGEDNDS